MKKNRKFLNKFNSNNLLKEFENNEFFEMIIIVNYVIYLYVIKLNVEKFI